jgi:hypothetical protein
LQRDKSRSGRQASTSATRYRNAARLAGPAYFASIRNSGRHFAFASTDTDRSPNFRTQLGFIPRLDIREWRNAASYTWRPQRGSLVSFGPGISEATGRAACGTGLSNPISASSCAGGPTFKPCDRSPSSSLVSLDNSKRLGADVLLTYFLHPGTALYLGYSDVRENVAFDPLLSPALRRTDFPDTMTGR